MEDTSKAIRTGALMMIILAVSWISLAIVLNVAGHYYSHASETPAMAIIRLFQQSHLWRFVLTLHALELLLMIPAGISVYYAFRHVSNYTMVVATIFLMISMFAFILVGLLWSSLDWHTGMIAARLQQEGHLNVFAFVNALNEYFNTYIAEYLGFFCSGVWMYLVGWVMLKGTDFPRSVSVMGFLLGLLQMASVLFKAYGLAPISTHGFDTFPTMGLWFLLVGGVLLAEGKEY